MSAKIGAAIVLAAALLHAAESPALEPEAAQFLAWYEKSWQGSFYPQDVLKGYRDHLGKDGVAAPEIERRVGVVQAAMKAMPVDFTRVHFNRVYSTPNPPFNQEPSQSLMRIVEGVKPGAAPDVAMGQGRNSVWLAGKGWKVTGYDLSEKGMSVARKAAKKAGLTIETVEATHGEFDLGKERWDLIVQTFAFTNLGDEAYRKRLFESLKKGGILLIEGFGGRSDNTVIKGFLDLHVIYYEDREDIADWSMQKARLTRIAVRKE
jgi:2-polyprenyl-3-methyl-5-hydroxy-6-metoxy-1,4-benzoquinol methylase